MPDTSQERFPRPAGLRMVAAYRTEWLPKDVLAGLVLTTLLVPQGMAYAELAGLPAITGLYTSILCLLGYAVFGPSRILVLGPDSSLGPMIAATIAPLVAADGDPARAVALASMLALIVGVVMVAGGFAKLGFVADLLSRPTMIGYMNGLAITILVGQLPKLFGFSIDADGFVDELRAFVDGVRDGETVSAALAVGVLALAVIAVLRRVLPRIPSVLIAVVASIAVAAAFDLDQHGVKLVGTLPEGFPPLTFPDVHRSDLPTLIGGALGIALVSLADTIATSSAFAGRSGEEVDGNREMIGIGAANLGAGLFQGFPVSTSGSRTAVAEQSGAKTQVAGLVGAITIAAMLLFVPGLFRDLPQPTLAAVVIAASLSLADIPGTVRLWKQRRSECALSIAAFLGVVFLGVLPGIAIAVALSVMDMFRRSWLPYYAVLGQVRDLPGYHDVSNLPGGRGASRTGHLPLRRAAVLREHTHLPRADPAAGGSRAAAGLDPGRGRADHRRRHDRRGHAGGSGRVDQRAGHLARVRRDEGPGAREDRTLRVDAHHRPDALLPDARQRRRRLPEQTGARVGATGLQVRLMDNAPETRNNAPVPRAASDRGGA